MALLAALLVLPVEPLQAQSYVPTLFGYGAQRPDFGVSPYRSRYFLPYGRYSPYRPERDFDEGEPYQQGGTVRTLCVRLCDGFYFPMSYAAPRGSLSRDADACSASCGMEAKLFYYPTHGGDIESMVDLSGMAYSSLPNAFKYRKTLVHGCSCRPQPWSDAEQRRHHGYARGVTGAVDARVDAPAHAAKDLAAPGSRAAGIETPHVPSPDEQHFVARPEPIVRQVDTPPLWPGRSRSAPRPLFVWPGER